MNRRAFIQNAAMAGMATGTIIQSAAGGDKPDAFREFYEYRVYSLKDDEQRKLVDEYLEKAFIPAMNRLGSSPVGVFSDPQANSALHVIIAHSSLDQFLKASTELLADAEHNKAGAAYLNIEAPAKAYERIESSLLQAFEGMPKLVLPPQAKEKRAHIVQLRIYESHSEIGGKKKIEMFHKGEIDAFKRAGTHPVFFSESIIGSKRPNLTYMLAFDDKAALDKAWGDFRQDPDFKRLISMPEYTDKRVVSHINNLILNAAPYSQI